jgi:hypothetical protein
MGLVYRLSYPAAMYINRIFLLFFLLLLILLCYMRQFTLA